MIGLKRGTVKLYQHEKEWEIEAQNTISRLKKILGNIIKDIQHVGSTSIPSIKAKPIIDIAVAVDDFNDILAFEKELKDDGFYYRPSVSIENQLLFACGSYYDGSGDLQTHFIHIVLINSMEWINYINFRDYLNNTPSIAKEYEELKVSLSRQAPIDSGREKYLKGKHSFIVSTLREAFIKSFPGKTIEKSCGTVLYTVINNTVYYLMIESGDGGYCGFPKGHAEYGESEIETALRETWEETSITAEINEDFKRYITYTTENGKTKSVVYFLANYSDQEPNHNPGFEVNNYLLLPYDEAYTRLTFESTKMLLKEADDFLKENGFDL